MKLCVFCKKFYINLDDTPYSEVTPGEEIEIGCLSSIWNMRNDGDVEEFREYIQKAETCEKYERSK